MSFLLDLWRYFCVVSLDGDWLNDYLGHLPKILQPHVLEVGKAVAHALGM